MTLRLDDVGASVIAEELSRSLGVPVILDVGKDGAPMSVEWANVEGEAVCRSFAARLGAAAEYDGRAVFIRKGLPGVEAFAVLRAGFVDVADAVNAVQTVTGDAAKVARVGDRLVVAGGPRAVERAGQLRGYFDRGPDGWVLEVRLVRLTDRLRRSVGLEWSVSGTARLGATAGAGLFDVSGPILGARASALVELIGEAVERTNEAELMYSAPLYLLEGREGRLQQGESVPVPKRTVSDQGTVTTTGYDNVDTGFILQATARRVPDGVLLELRPELSAVLGFVDAAPIVGKSAVASTVVVRSGEWCILAGLEAADSRRDTAGLPGLPAPLFKRDVSDRSRSSLLVLIRATRVYAGAAESPPASSP